MPLGQSGSTAVMGSELCVQYWVGFDDNYTFPSGVGVARTKSGNKACLGAADRV